MYYSNYKKVLDFKYIILEFCEKHQATFSFENHYHVQIYTTEYVIKSITNNYKDLHLLYEIEDQLDCDIYIGIGVAEEIVVAEKNALKSIKFAFSDSRSSAYITKYTQEEVTGPLWSKHSSNISYTTAITNKELISLSQRLSISPIVINKLIAIIEYNKNNRITAYHLSEFLGVSLRSANRLLRKLQDAGVAIVVGEDQPAGRGRPRKIYQINLPKIHYN